MVCKFYTYTLRLHGNKVYIWSIGINEFPFDALNEKSDI